jgi:hypothetical protein
MVKMRKCLKCLREFDKKSTYDNHINKKFSCLKNEENISNIPNIPNIPNTEKLIDMSNIILCKDINDNISDNDDLRCVKCLKTYSTKYNLNKHYKKYCGNVNNNEINSNKEKIDINNNTNILNQDLEFIKTIKNIVEQNNILIKTCVELKEENKEIKKKLKSQVGNNSKTNKQNININIDNSSNNNNYGNIVNIQAHGKENLNQIPNKVLLDAIRKGQGVSHITNIIESIYLNPNFPENHNIYISDINRQKCMIHDGFKWILSDINKIYDMISRVISFSKDKHDEFVLLYQNNKNIQDKLKIFKKYLNFCDPEYLQELKEQQEEFDDHLVNVNEIKRCRELIELLENNVIKLFYNSRDMIMDKK